MLGISHQICQAGALNEGFASVEVYIQYIQQQAMGESQVKVIVLFPFASSCLFFQEVVIVHEKEEMQFSDFDWGGLRETSIDFCVNPPARADLAGGREAGTTGPERRDLAGKLLLPSQKYHGRRQ